MHILSCRSRKISHIFVYPFRQLPAHMNTLPISQVSAAPANVVQGLQKSVAQSFALTALAQNAHVNVVGPDFYQLHEAFQGIYEGAFASVDKWAERMRALDGVVNLCLTEMDTMSGLPCLKTPFSAQEAVNTLITAQSIIITDLEGLMNLAESSGDKVTANMVQDEIASLQKSRWMLRSYLR